MNKLISTRQIDRRIAALSVPAVVSNLAVPLLGLSDTAITGHLGSPVYLGGIAVGAMMCNVALWLFGFLRMGTSGLVAQAYGADSWKNVRVIASQSFYLALAIGFSLAFISGPLGKALIALMGADTKVSATALRYFSICIWGAPAQLATMALLGWFFGMQSTLWPMVITICTNVINVILSVVYVFAADWGFEGVAWGTFCSSWCGLAIALVAAIRFSSGPLFLSPRKVIGPSLGLHRFFRVNSDIMIRSGCILAVTLGLTSFGARQGEVVLAANAVILQFVHFFSYFMDGPAFTAEILCGRYAGARNESMLKRCVARLLLWSAILATVFLVIYSSWGVDLASLLTSDAPVREEIYTMRWWLALVPALTVSAYIFDGIYIGLTATRRMLVATLVAAAVFFCIEKSSALFSDFLSPNGVLWSAYLLYLLLRGGILAAMAPGVIKQGIA